MRRGSLIENRAQNQRTQNQQTNGQCEASAGLIENKARAASQSLLYPLFTTH